jgi:hypothetical protein
MPIAIRLSDRTITLLIMDRIRLSRSAISLTLSYHCQGLSEVQLFSRNVSPNFGLKKEKKRWMMVRKDTFQEKSSTHSAVAKHYLCSSSCAHDRRLAVFRWQCSECVLLGIFLPCRWWQSRCVTSSMSTRSVARRLGRGWRRNVS